MAQSNTVTVTATPPGEGMDADRGVQIGDSTEYGQTPVFGSGGGFSL